MQVLDKLPAKQGIVGTREIAKSIKAGKIKRVIIATNCPDFIIEKMKSSGVEIQIFSGDQKNLGTRLGKPFPVAIVGYE